LKASLFISYSHKDQTWLDRLTNHLASLENDQLIEVWDDREIRAGDQRGWEAQLLPKLQQAQILVILLSPSFAASNYCQKTELPLAIERKRSGRALVFLVHLVSYAVEQALQEFQILPSPSKAISEYPNVDAALRDVAKAIKDELSAAQTTARPSAPSALPSYLPYLCDRMEQEDELQLLAEEQPDRQNRPLVFLVGGPRQESHHAFQDRLGRDFLPRLLAGNPAPVEGRPLDTSGWQSAPGDRMFAMRVARTLDALDRDALVEALPDGLTFLTITLDVDDPRSGHQKWLGEFLAYWNRWPDLPAGRALCVGISLAWDSNGPTTEELRQQYPASDFGKLRFKVLAELMPPVRQNALAWLQHPKVKRHYDHERHADRAREEIDLIFAKQRSVAMQDLARRLRETLERCA